jgi:hypothetical protein
MIDDGNKQRRTHSNGNIMELNAIDQPLALITTTTEDDTKNKDEKQPKRELYTPGCFKCLMYYVVRGPCPSGYVAKQQWWNKWYNREAMRCEYGCCTKYRTLNDCCYHPN